MKRDGCRDCPRQCGADREKRVGYCGTGSELRVARIGLHPWEEPCISYGSGSGTVFFSGCNLRCVFCQNHVISQAGGGRVMELDALAQAVLDLQAQGAVNLNLVTPSHYTRAVRELLRRVRPQLHIPVVYNSSGYDSVEALRQLEGLVDIYLPDLKYCAWALSGRYSGAPDYFSVASAALAEMYRQVGYARFEPSGAMNKGVLTRHLVLPGCYRDSLALLDYLAERYDASRFALSLMSQYFPAHRAAEFPELNRRITTFEYKKVVTRAQDLGFCVGYTQERDSAQESYVPDFDTEQGSR